MCRSCAPSSAPQRRWRDGGDRDDSTRAGPHDFTRRTFVKGSGALAAGFSRLGRPRLQAFAAGEKRTVAIWPKPPVDQVDSFLEITTDGKVIGKVGKGTGSMGLITSIQQLFAEELDVPMSTASR